MYYIILLHVFSCTLLYGHTIYNTKYRIRQHCPKSTFLTPIHRSTALFGVTNEVLITQQEDVNWIRHAVVELIEDSWYNIANIVQPTILLQCENDMKGAISLLVLAIVNNVAESSSQNKNSVETLLKAADGNDDGQLTFIEWIEWLGKTSDSPSSPIFVTAARSSPFSRLLLLNLKHALDCAMSSVILATRITSNPSLVIAAFVAGGMSSGKVQSVSFGDALVNRVAPEVRCSKTMIR